jgi:hypothetical protein
MDEINNAVEYKVELGQHSQSMWIKKLAKKCKKSVWKWNQIQNALLSEFKYIDVAIKKFGTYTILSCSKDNNIHLLKYDVKTDPKVSAKQSGVRATLLKINYCKVVILFLGHHSDYGKNNFNSEKDCIKHLVKQYYPELAESLNI